MGAKTFATVINCMDGRTQLQVNEYLKMKYGVDYVDTITEPGPNKILAENKDAAIVESIKKRVDISVTRHGSKAVAIVGHHGCAGNPADKKEQAKQTRAAIEIVKSWGYDVEVVGLWVNDLWLVSEVD